MIHKTYQVNRQTIALRPAKVIDHSTIVIEQEETYKIKETPLQIIKEACIANWSTYEGRRQAVIHHTNFKQKVPIPSTSKKISLPSQPTHQQNSNATGSFSTISPTSNKAKCTTTPSSHSKTKNNSHYPCQTTYSKNNTNELSHAYWASKASFAKYQKAQQPLNEKLLCL